MTAKIVLLNGVGSAGKSSIARALQTIATEPFLHVQMDAFIDMLPPALQDHADGFSFETVLEDGKPSVVIRSGPVGASHARHAPCHRRHGRARQQSHCRRRGLQ
ncbi:hypothetical protein NLY43_21245 [Mesorhizobium sp. C416B]|uniref:phosphotransferase-like protein n=1 Tax=unclassified Mesorhizobium TaxID=325217 RepID=UPI00041F9B44|nr:MULTISPECIES: hypothetical protein [unclassified Mesorhizobium]WJI61134.1 hypothetical protein NLY43_21245 [Mesorhizobium sp. C416B]